jgi:endonuclease-3
MTKKEKVKKIIEVLDRVYPDAKTSLNYKEPYQLLIATQLAAQCTDERVNKVTPALFDRYKSIADFAGADLEELMGYIRSTGFFRNKAKNIIGCCKRLISEYNSVVPDNMEDLLTLPGVGRKTANIILGDVYKKPSIVVDTHAGRLSRRMGLTKKKDPKKVEFDLMRIVPPEDSTRFCHALVLHGRKYCKARKPNCQECPVSHLCGKII